MTSKPLVRVELADYFLKDLKRLHKKHPRVREDVQALVRTLERGETPGDQVQGVGHTVYKVRLPNRDSQRGKSGGYRVIYFVKTSSFIVLLTIYSKSQREDIAADDVRRIIES